MTEDNIKRYIVEWLKLLTSLNSGLSNPVIPLYDYIKLREGTK